MKIFSKGAATFTLFIGVSGCMSGGGSGGGDDRLSYAQQEALASQYQTEIAGLASTDPTSLPTVGSTSYTGIVSIAANSNTIVFLGDLNLVADFMDSSVTGDLSNINDSSGANYGGQIPLTNGMIDRNAAVGETVTGDLIGDVTDGAGNTVSFDTDLSGDFFDDETYIAGDISGDLTIDGSVTTIENDLGAFVVSDGS